MTNTGYTPLTYRIAFAGLQGMGVDLARKLLDVVGSEERFFAMGEKELRQLTRGRSKIYRDDYRRECLELAQREGCQKFCKFFVHFVLMFFNCLVFNDLRFKIQRFKI